VLLLDYRYAGLFYSLLQDQAFEEQMTVCGEDLPPLSYDQVGVSIQHLGGGEGQCS